MKQLALALLILSVALSSRTFAALGNDESEVENLFGKPLKQSAPDKRGITTYLYSKGNYVILVQFLRHLSLAESYARADQHDLSQKEIDAFLEGSSNGRPWAKDPTKLEWVRMDNKARAWCTTVQNRQTLLIQAD